MSNVTKAVDQTCEKQEKDGDIQRILIPKGKDLGGFTVRRVLPTIHQKKIGPWVFLDHMGPHTFPSGQGINVRPHPHIGLATVTYLFEGEALHRDSLGNELTIYPGEINLMVAGKGIVHSERKQIELQDSENHGQSKALHGLQLWVALPEKDEEMDPAFFHYGKEEIPTIMIDGVKVRLLIGSAFENTSPVQMYADTLYFEAFLKKGQRLVLPEAEERGVYVVSGGVSLGETTIDEHTMAVLNPGSDMCIVANDDSQIALVGGERLSRRYIEWNFVSSRKERIEQAKADWKAGKFALVPGDEDELIPLPE